ncbi:hypothetical protein H6S82_00145 [Planktothrix sp. FACHB-1355]|uniref:Uncharacterized protein n=1 Tax=Aerosakkonema funiforme FACHB-1375 TaxID=2949571 RepID=A0A926VER6_9CYAN|nr:MULTISPECIES: hypothetical protein [Oscillatoriales]MBD2181863.1 hypothetical protein [Aerosakkonema funiforme FACHB-1375]MBD3557283.1 hypothetical protein [Planktothrix sp. FACHB-1355]
MYHYSSYGELILLDMGAIEPMNLINKDYHVQIQQHTIERLVDKYGIESVIARLSEYCQTQAMMTSGNIYEYWQDIAEVLSQIPEGWDVE